MLGKINSLQSPDRGCYASNQWLGKWFNKHPNWVSRMISKFKDLGLITIKYRMSGNKCVERQIRVSFQGFAVNVGVNGAVNVGVKETRRKTTNRRGLAPPADGEMFLDKAIKCLVGWLETKGVRFDDRKRRRGRKQLQWLLVKDLDSDRARLKRVLQGYVRNEGRDQYQPKIWNVADFRQKFNRIEAWLNKHEPPKPKEEYEVEIVSRKVIR